MQNGANHNGDIRLSHFGHSVQSVVASPRKIAGLCFVGIACGSLARFGSGTLAPPRAMLSLTNRMFPGITDIVESINTQGQEFMDVYGCLWCLSFKKI